MALFVSVEEQLLARFRSQTAAAPVAARLYGEGALHLAAGAPAEAESAFRGALDEGPGAYQQKVRHGLGHALLRLGRADEAEAVFRCLATERPDLLDPKVGLGLALLGQQRPQEALRCLRAALEAHPGHRDLVRVLADGAVAFDRLGQAEQGRDWCVRGLELIGKEPTLLMNVATFSLRIGDLEAARQALREASTCGPDVATEAAADWAEYGDGSAL